jgi:AraC family transcriptional regulator
MDGAIAGEERAIACRMRTPAFFEIESVIATDGISAEIRHYGWNRACDSFFEPDSHYVEMGLLRSGRAFTLAPHERHFVEPGRIILLPAGMRFRTRCEPGEHRTLAVTIDPERLTTILDPHEREPGLVPFCHDVQDLRVERCMVRLLEELREPGCASELLVESLVTVLVIELERHLRWRHRSDAEMGGKLAPWRLKRVKDRVAADLDKTLSIEALADECGMSARHLIRTFKNSEGITLSEYIAHERISRARQQLRSTEPMIKEIAAQCGFASAASFSSAFRKATGETPRQFRERAFRFASHVLADGATMADDAGHSRH